MLLLSRRWPLILNTLAERYAGLTIPAIEFSYF
ncbi:hypothetical protein RD1_0681 [Roseobacter denitrificans OCh 114]|uniref:Uncharacterized protein n=1 Tax=Roseobacter denitrificans (strain ATCC 33942 / OCh 114) TaxID=375451 RepID=Q16CB5_ROSDO|nr:hypothetical protein RD1_0681 [Roseobacter denitrificans OCh 114]